jgi:lipoprotein-anchoring transpeptidase ErfK/SrfK
MLLRFLKLVAAGALSLCILLPATASTVRQRETAGEKLDIAGINAAEWQGKTKPSLPLLIKLQVLLDRAHVSPGEIDGNFGENTHKAIAAFRDLRGLQPGDQVDEQVWHALTDGDSEPALVTYNIGEKDTAGPFVKRIPTDFKKQAVMHRLAYTSPQELLAEKFHMSQQLLRRLNPGTSFDKAGQEIIVANVEHKPLPTKVHRIVVDAQKQLVLAYGKNDKVEALYPATVGSGDRPTPEGEFKVTKVTENPTYHYDPSLHFRGVHVQHELDIPPGPNNPVGAVWISLSAEGYGIHGTPDPDKISKSASHGCIRLTNWDALELGHAVSEGTPVLITRSEKISQTEETRRR